MRFLDQDARLAILQETLPMTLTSYAPNGEDIVLHRALADVENGFYVDIGAYDPVNGSVSKLFYDKGWSGANVEPVREYFNKFVFERTRDKNLNIAVSDQAGLREFIEIPSTSLSTFHKSIAERHQQAGLMLQETLVSVVTGEDLLSKFGGREIHFLNITVGGSESNIFRSIDFTKYRPWIILASAIDMYSQERIDHEWSSILTDNEYTSVYFDGVKVFYLANEQSSRRSDLSKPPNTFDNFATYSQRLANETAEVSRVQSNAYQRELMKNCSKIDGLEFELVTAGREHGLLTEKLRSLESIVERQNKEIEDLKANIGGKVSEIANLRAYIDEINP